MSKKQEVKIHLLQKFFRNLDLIDDDLPMHEMGKKCFREMDNYITQTLNMSHAAAEGVHWLNPKLFELLGLAVEQNQTKYKNNPNDDSCVARAFAFKMLVGE